RARLFDVRPVPLESLATERKSDDDPTPVPVEATGAKRPVPHPGAVAEIGQILHGLSRTTARIWVIDRDLNVLARAGSLRQPVTTPEGASSGVQRTLRARAKPAVHP